jgi:PIN domain nuclease of toxin-antitoxin system
MILLDTHIWVWWVRGEVHLSETPRVSLETHDAEGFVVRMISCWAVAKGVAYARLTLSSPIAVWRAHA